jgi:hypothetical protein
MRLNLPMVCSAAVDDDGDAPDRRGAYGLLDGVAMLAALADQRVSVALGVPVFNYQHRCGYRVAVRSLHMGRCRRRGGRSARRRRCDARLEVCWTERRQGCGRG